jgi:hypothetical protein
VDTQSPIPTLADGGYLTGHPCYFVVIRFLKKESRYIRGAILTVSLVIIDDKARDEILEFFTRRLAS